MLITQEIIYIIVFTKTTIALFHGDVLANSISLTSFISLHLFVSSTYLRTTYMITQFRRKLDAYIYGGNLLEACSNADIMAQQTTQ